MKMVYPAYFPDVPPQVKPVEPERLSMHQYGSDGELCLEFRPDNWSPEFTGAMMIESACRLLTGEAPSEGEIAEVPSAHRASLGRDLRSTWFRVVVPPELHAAIIALEPAQLLPAQFGGHFTSDRVIVNPLRLGSEDAPLWSTQYVIEEATLRPGFVLRLAAGASIPTPLDRSLVRELLSAAGATDALDKLDKATGELYILFAATDELRLVSLPAEQDKIYNYVTVALPEPRTRLSEDYGSLGAKAVAIVGCGSVGSKIAASLARSGVGRFVLVDEDVLIPGNLARNDLDVRSVGIHKVDAVSTRIKHINPRATIDVRRLALGGQEASSSADNVFKSIAGCDLIIDATADPQGFNLCAAIARREKKPMVWGEVFAGGIGGLVARSRPNFDPPPHYARRQLLAWCASHEVPWEGIAIDYDHEPADGPPLVADDAAVSIIASHMTAIATDILLREKDSRFGSPAYAIGFAKKWIFAGPFDVWPIDYSDEGAWGAEEAKDHKEQLGALVAELFPDLSK